MNKWFTINPETRPLFQMLEKLGKFFFHLLAPILKKKSTKEMKKEAIRKKTRPFFQFSPRTPAMHPPKDDKAILRTFSLRSLYPAFSGLIAFAVYCTGVVVAVGCCCCFDISSLFSLKLFFSNYFPTWPLF